MPDSFSATTVAATPRSRWAAAALSLLCPGLGQVYATRRDRGLTIVGVAVAVQGAAVAATLPPPSPLSFALLLAMVAVYLGLYLFAFVDAIRCAGRWRHAPLGLWNQRWVYVFAVVGWSAVTQITSSLIEQQKQFAAYTIPAQSMAPGLVPGDYLVAQRDHFANREPQYGDVAVFTKPGPEPIPYVKRVVGLPGDRVQLTDGRLLINGQAMPQREDGPNVFVESLPNGHSYRVRIDNRRHFMENTPVYQVPAGSYFLLGDNRENSADSRFTDEIGFVPRSALHDRALFLFWAQDLGRIGQSVE